MMIRFAMLMLLVLTLGCHDADITVQERDPRFRDCCPVTVTCCNHGDVSASCHEIETLHCPCPEVRDDDEEGE